MCSPMAGRLGSPLRRLATPRLSKHIMISPVRNETILVKNNEEFIAKVMNSSKPVIVNFHAEWCDPCRLLTPRLTELVARRSGLALCVLDVEQHADLVHTFEVKAVPAVIAIRDGVVVDKFIGLVDADMIESLIDKMDPKEKQ